MSEISPDVAAVLRADYVEAVRERRPALVVRTQSVCKNHLRAEKLALPLSEDDAVPDRLLVAVYDGVPDKAYPGG